MNDHVDEWGLPLFEGNIFDAMPSSVEGHADNGMTASGDNADWDLSRHFDNWDPVDVAEQNDESSACNTLSMPTDTSSSLAQNSNAIQPATTSNKPYDRKGYAQLRTIIRKQFEKLNWTPEMSVKVLTAHVDLMRDDNKPRVVTCAIEKMLKEKGADSTYIGAFKSRRRLNRQNATYMEKTADKVSGEASYKFAQENGIFQAMEKIGVDFEKDPIVNVEMFTRDDPVTGKSAEIYDKAFIDYIQRIRGGRDARIFKTFRDQHRQLEFQTTMSDVLQGKTWYIVLRKYRAHS